MSDVTLQDTARFILENRCPDRLTIVTFYGGEALLALDKMKRLISTLRESLAADVGFSISTNGYALTPDVIDWLVTILDCDVYITIDGYRELHDQNRKTVNGMVTYQKILDNLTYFSKKYPEDFLQRVNYLVTLERWAQLPEVSDRWNADSFFKNKLPKHLSFILPKNLEEMQHPVSSTEERVQILETAFERYQQGEISLLTAQFVEWTDNIYRNMQTLQDGHEIVVQTCMEDMYRTFISAEGDIYICERFNSPFTIGHVASGLQMEKALHIENQFISRRNLRCKNCSAATLCRICMTSLNYNDNEMAALCATERAMIDILKAFTWKRRMFDRNKQLLNNN